MQSWADMTKTECKRQTQQETSGKTRGGEGEAKGRTDAGQMWSNQEEDRRHIRSRKAGRTRQT